MIFVQYQLIIMYESTTASLTCGIVYLILRYGQVQGLIHCQKPLVTVVFGLYNICFGTKVAEAWI